MRLSQNQWSTVFKTDHEYPSLYLGSDALENAKWQERFINPSRDVENLSQRYLEMTRLELEWITKVYWWLL